MSVYMSTSMTFLLDTKKVRFNALDKAIHNLPPTEEQFIDSIELDEFDAYNIKEAVKASKNLHNYSTRYIGLICEVIDLLDEYKGEFFVNKKKYIIFSWSGNLIYKITINKEGLEDTKVMKISLRTYNDEKDSTVYERKMNIWAGLGVGSVLITGITLTYMSLLRAQLGH